MCSICRNRVYHNPVAMSRWKLVIQKYTPPTASHQLVLYEPWRDRHQAALLFTLIWSYSLAVTCPPLFGWGHYDLVAAQIRFVESKSK